MSVSKIIEFVTGDLAGKKRYRAIQRRAKALPPDYKTAYDAIQRYVWTATGVETMTPFESLLDLFEEGAANGRAVLDITGKDVAAFVDELVYGEKGYIQNAREKLNKTLADKLGKAEPK